LKGKQEGRRKIEGTMRIGGISPQAAETETSNAMTTSMAEEAGNTTSANDNRAYSNGGSRENECSDVILLTEGEGCSKKSLHNGSR